MDTIFLMKLNREDILDNFNDEAHRKGFEYYKSNMVLMCNVQEDEGGDIFINSIVKSSELYTQKINLLEFDDILIDSECSCSVGHNCQHAVAVLYQMMDDDKSYTPKDEATLWLDKFTKIYKKKQSIFLQDKDHFLVFRLFENGYNNFEFYKAKVLKNGTLSKGTKVSRENMFRYVQYEWKYDFLTDEDRSLVAYLKNTLNIDNLNSFEGEYGAFVLKKICETQRCYFRKSNTPLKFCDEKKRLTFEWTEGAGGSLLVSNLRSNEFLIIYTIPPFCVDMKENTLYPIETEYNAEALAHLLKSPIFSEEEIAKVTEGVLQVLPDAEFPIPESFEIEEINPEPKPNLYLYAQQDDKQKMHLMELHFFYDDYEIKSHPPKQNETLFFDHKRIRVIRDSETERLYREAIESFGFIFDARLSAYMSDANPHKQASIDRWRDFMHNGIPKLREEGWEIEIDETFNFNFEYMDSISVETTGESEHNPWFELSFTVDIGGSSVALLPIVASLIEEFDTVDEIPAKLNLELEEGRYLHVDSEEIRPILRTIFELFDKKKGDSLIIKPYDAHLLDLDEHSNIVWKGTKELQELSRKLKAFEGIESVEPMPQLNAKLRDYQQFGLDWLYFLHTFKFGGILADDMGLGKTIQTLAFLQLLKARGEMQQPSLIVMPTSLIGNWKNEIKKFTPDLRYLELYGADRAQKFEQIASYDVILTTYALAHRDQEKYDKEQFFYIILDEAQKIKNPKTKLATAIKGFHSSHKLALSGTPIENHLGELWSIFDFLMPGFLGNLSFFKALYQKPIEQEHDMTRGELLNKKIKPFILRRTKDEVVKELPPKTVIIKKAIFGKKQATLYENIRVTMEAKVREAIKGKGLERSHLTILDALLKLRQVCCHPGLLKLESAKNIKESTKLDMFLELIDELHSEGRKVLVFSQFTSMLSIIEEEIVKLKIPYTKLTGSTRKRDEVIEKFTQGDAQIFLISLKAGGIGLNLVEADTVIHYDPWWNPAVENQATDRAYRIGQDKPVFVYKLIVENSIEEQILKLQEKKKGLQEGIYQSKDKKKNDGFTGDELVELLRM